MYIYKYIYIYPRPPYEQIKTLDQILSDVETVFFSLDRLA